MECGTVLHSSLNRWKQFDLKCAQDALSTIPAPAIISPITLCRSEG